MKRGSTTSPSERERGEDGASFFFSREELHDFVSTEYPGLYGYLFPHEGEGEPDERAW